MKTIMIVSVSSLGRNPLSSDGVALSRTNCRVAVPGTPTGITATPMRELRFAGIITVKILLREFRLRLAQIKPLCWGTLVSLRFPNTMILATSTMLNTECNGYERARTNGNLTFAQNEYLGLFTAVMRTERPSAALTPT